MIRLDLLFVAFVGWGVVSQAQAAEMPATPRDAVVIAGPVPSTRAPATCPGDVLGTSRNIAINPGAAPIHVGLKSYPQTLALADHEVVLTFDDGPSRETTPAILKALRDQCVQATFFLIGRNAAEHPALVRREIAEGHTVGHHSGTHPFFTLRGFDTRSAEADIEAGISAVEHAGYDDPRPPSNPHVPFFRFPGFADTAALVASLDRRRIAVFGTDLWAADWLKMTPDYERQRVIGLLERSAHHSGIILFHDTKTSTAEMLPGLLRDLREKHYKIVHLTVSDGGPPTELTVPLRPFSSETDRIIAHVWPPIVEGSHHTAAAVSQSQGGQEPMGPFCASLSLVQDTGSESSASIGERASKSRRPMLLPFVGRCGGRIKNVEMKAANHLSWFLAMKGGPHQVSLFLSVEAEVKYRVGKTELSSCTPRRLCFWTWHSRTPQRPERRVGIRYGSALSLSAS